MAQKYTLNSSGTAFERVLPSALIHLSDGTLAFIHRTASGVYELAYTTDRATVTPIATLPIGTTSSTFRDAGFGPQGFALCRDASDNLFVVGGLGSASYKAAAQAFTKGAGLTWTQQALVALGGATSGGFLSVAATWCNTGGGTSGAGHLAVLLSANGGGSRFITADAGAVLTGTAGGAGFVYPTNSSLFGSIVPGYSVCLSPDGFGAASGLASTNPSAGSTYPVGSWSVSSTGTATLASLGTESGTAANISSGIPAQLVRVSANLWGLVLGSGATAGSWSAARYSSMGRLTAAADAGSPSGMPLTSSPNSVQATWGAFADPTTTGRAWVITVNASTGAVTRLGVGLSSGVSWDAAATSVDTVSPVVSAGTNGVVAQPVSTLVDWQVYAQTVSTPTYALLGDYSSFVPAIPDSVGVLIG